MDGIMVRDPLPSKTDILDGMKLGAEEALVEGDEITCDKVVPGIFEAFEKFVVPEIEMDVVEEVDVA
ncbi:hypothetical protein WICMUC_004294 [Wickerhamomyces mucosus]|uniref:Uncharacterized protein n=1 Tax=Wickerhamomyces mucosus TaxID=1378264 RepID=A0A9P8PHG1_9ASCO|nr:hypothetical protein WICMUC_004294 [Wickerhamomyces mucosus]